MGYRGILIFVRHGETAWNVEHRIQGCTDIPLNDTGREQGRGIPDKLRAEQVRIGLILASTLARASEYTQIVTDGLVIPRERVIFDPRMRECSFGDLEGKTAAELDEERARLIKYVHGADYDFRPYGGEHRDAVIARQIAAIDEHASRLSDGDSILLVGHGRSLATLLSHLRAPYELPQGGYYIHRMT